MKFGVRDICDVTFKAKTAMTIGSAEFKAGQPVLMMETATASTLEQSTTSVYARGGHGNTKLVTWEGEKELTFTVTDALISPISLSILSGAGLYKANNDNVKVHLHRTTRRSVLLNGTSGSLIDLSADLASGETIDGTAPIFIVKVEADGSVTGNLLTGFVVGGTGDKENKVLTASANNPNTTVLVDYYVTKLSSKVNEIQIDANSFGGNFYVEALTNWRAQQNGKDYPCQITLPNVKIQSNFSFSMSATGDPSTFDFTMDAMPGYTYFDDSHEVLCVMQIVEDTNAGTATRDTVMGHNKVTIATSADDSTEASGEV